MSYIILDRKMANWEWKDEPNMVALWIEILLQANYKPNSWHGEVYEPGSFPTTVAKLACNTGLTDMQVRTCLTKLEKTGEITHSVNNRITKINVVKWADYQHCDIPVNNKITTKTSTSYQRNNNRNNNENSNEITTLKEIKNIRKEEIKHIYGKYGRVKLTDSQRQNLEKELGTKAAEDCIQILDNYCETNNKTYNNYYQCIHNWVIDKYERENASQHYKEKREFLATDIKPDYTQENSDTDMSNLEKFLNERTNNG